jgi:hypothetical protein
MSVTERFAGKVAFGVAADLTADHARGSSFDLSAEEPSPLEAGGL